MELYFTNDSRQKKLLIESDYAEDIYDTTIAFFEEKNKYPHFLHIEETDTNARISFGSTSEFFVIEGFSEEDYEYLYELFKEHDIY